MSFLGPRIWNKLNSNIKTAVTIASVTNTPSIFLNLLKFLSSFPETVARRCSVTKRVHRNFATFTGKHLCQSLSFHRVEKETLAQMFCYEFCEISKNAIFAEHLW